MDKAIVGIALGLRAVTFYEIANRIRQGAPMVQSVAASSLLPASAYLRRDRGTLRELYLRRTTYTVAVALPVVVSAFIFAEDLIRTWVGESLVDAGGSARLFLVFVAFVAVHATGAAMIVALGPMRFVIAVTVAFTVINLVVSIALVEPLGVNGVILGTLVAQAAIWLPYTLRFFHTFDVMLGQWLRQVIRPNLPGLVLQGATAAPLLYVAGAAGNLLFVALIALVSVALSLIAFVAVGLPRDARLLLLSALKGAFGRADTQPPSEDLTTRGGPGVAASGSSSRRSAGP